MRGINIMKNENEIREEICEIGRRMYSHGLVATNDGNISVKLDEDRFLCTPTGVSKGYMTPDCLCIVNAKNELVESNGDFKPTSEMKMHIRVYEKRPDINAVVHAHPPYAMTFAIIGEELNEPVMPEAFVNFRNGRIPVAKYGTPSTMELPDSLDEFVEDYNALLLEFHGALTYGDTLMRAYMDMESLEYYTRILYQLKTMGKLRVLDEEKLDKLRKIMGS